MRLRLGVKDLPDTQERTDLHPGPLGVGSLVRLRRAGADRDVDPQGPRADLLDPAFAAAKEVGQVCDVGGVVERDPQRAYSFDSYLADQVSARARVAATRRWCSSTP